MKVATFTFHRNCNYGANLQAYALQQAITALGHETEILDYDYTAERKGILKKSFHLIFNSAIRKKKNNFINFQRKHLRISEKCEKQHLEEYANKYDRIVVGSDQVWNYIITEKDSSYFLDYVPLEKRRSYAASFGISSIPFQYRSFYEKYLPGFRNYSVRERTGAKLVEDLINEEAIVDLDPVGLLTVSQWGKLIHSVRDTGYIFLYMPSKREKKYALDLSKKLDMKIVHVGVKSLLHPSQNIGDMYEDIGPEEFLSLLYYADYVVTGSFHGTILSILFNKNFIVDIPPKVGSRITDLLEDFNLMDHIISSDAEKADTDWVSVNAIMEKRRKESLQRLAQYLK